MLTAAVILSTKMMQETSERFDKITLSPNHAYFDLGIVFIFGVISNDTIIFGQ